MMLPMLVDSLIAAGVSTDWARASTATVTTFCRIAATASEVTSWAERSALRTGRKATRSAISAIAIPASRAHPTAAPKGRSAKTKRA